jgi:hypothetical protein
MELRGGQWVALGGLLLLVVATVYPVFENGFVYDDVDMIERGDVIHDPSEILTFYVRNTMYASPVKRDTELMVDTYRPVTMTSFFWDSALSGRSPWAYHLTNLAMHLACVVLVFFFVRGFVGRNAWPYALFGAAWFALSPHPASAHVWINGRSDLFATFFGLAAILTWRRGLSRTGGLRAAWIAASASLFLLGLMSKEVLVAAWLPIVLWPETTPDLRWTERLKRTAGFSAAIGIYLALRVSALDGVRTNEGPAHIFTAISYLAPVEIEGLLGALYPRRLYLRFMSEEFGALSVVSLIALAVLFLAIGGVAFSVRKRLPLVSWGMLWFASCIAPVAIVAGLLWPGFGRYLYLPSAGLAVAIAALAQLLWTRIPHRRVLWAGAGVLYLTALALSLRGWVHDFRNEETLYLATIERNPEGAHGYGWLGISRAARDRYDDAIGPLTIAHKLAPDVPRYPIRLLDAFARTGRLSAAEKLAVEAAPLYGKDSAPFHLFLLERAHMSDPSRATFQVLECLRKAPGSTECGNAFTHLVTRHPRRDEHLAAAHAWLRESEFSAVRAQTAPLLDSL